MTAMGFRRARAMAAAEAQRPRHPKVLALYTAATIAAGFGALAVSTLTIPLDPRIALPLPGGDSEVAGLVLWVLFGLAGALRILRNPSGQGVLTFHLPFIVAAMALGGPVAGAWVGMLSTFDRHELEEAPWYGILANHAAFALAAVIGGLVMQGILDIAAPAVADATVQLLAIAAGTTVFTVGSVAMAVGTIVLRANLELRDAVQLFNHSYRRTTVAETVLGWLLAVVYATVGWWGPVVCAALVLALWQADADHGRLDRDSLTGLLNRDGFRARTSDIVDLARRGGPGATMLYLDINRFGELNKRIGYLAANEILVEIAHRIRGLVRVTDVAGRIYGDEFAVLYPGVMDTGTAEQLAWRLHDALAAPYTTSSGDVIASSGSVGVAMLDAERPVAGSVLEELSAGRMFYAKHHGLGVELERTLPREGQAGGSRLPDSPAPDAAQAGPTGLAAGRD